VKTYKYRPETFRVSEWLWDYNRAFNLGLFGCFFAKTADFPGWPSGVVIDRNNNVRFIRKGEKDEFQATFFGGFGRQILY